MLVILGYIVVCACVFGGFVWAGGHLGSLWQPKELLMIGGAAVGAFFVGNNMKSVKATMKALPTVFQGSKYTKDMYMELMALLYESGEAPTVAPGDTEPRPAAETATLLLAGLAC